MFPNFMLSLKNFRDSNVEEACKKYPGEQSMATAHNQLTTNIVLSNEHDYTYCRLHQDSYLSSTAHAKAMMAIWKAAWQAAYPRSKKKKMLSIAFQCGVMLNTIFRKGNITMTKN